MSDLPPDTEKLLLAFLDDGLPPQERDEVERMIDADPQIAEYLELQDKIEGSLRRSFSPPAANPDFLRKLAEPIDQPELQHAGPTPERPERRRLVLTSLATAASIAIAWLSVKSFVSTPDATIAYRERPLLEVYDECVRDGFEPYWVCDDPDLFAATFERRQGVRLKLGELPAGREMLGLSYLAGLSRNSTSMLATVDGRRVIIIVDRIENDWRPATGLLEKAGLRITRWERYGLAFYQVGPPETPQLDDAFGLADTETVPEEGPQP